MGDNATIFILAAIFILAVVGVVYLAFTRNSSPSLNKSKFQTRWLEIEHSLNREQLATYQFEILNADKLLDEALRDRHIKGASMGERMKNANSSWSNANYIWGAHKVRNQLAHEHDYKLTRETALRALSAYKQALKDIGAI